MFVRPVGAAGWSNDLLGSEVGFVRADAPGDRLATVAGRLRDVANASVARRRELLDDRCRDGAALGERPGFHFTWTAVPAGAHAVQLALTGATLRHPERLAPGLRAALGDWRAVVESWSVEFAADPLHAPLRPDQRWHRTRQQPSLGLLAAPHSYPGPGPFLARIRVVDCFGAAHELGFTVAWREGQLSIAPAPDPR